MAQFPGAHQIFTDDAFITLQFYALAFFPINTSVFNTRLWLSCG